VGDPDPEPLVRARAAARLLALGLALAAGALSGCRSYLRPMDLSPLPPCEAETEDGGRLRAEDGRLSLLPARHDAAALLGARLADDAQGRGVLVLGRTRSDAGGPGGSLAAGDRIVHWAVAAPRGAEPTTWTAGGAGGSGSLPYPSVEAAVEGEARGSASSFPGVRPRLDPRDISWPSPGDAESSAWRAALKVGPPTPEALRRAAVGAAVGSRRDLAGIGALADIGAVDLVVVRGGREASVRARLRAEGTPLPTVPATLSLAPGFPSSWGMTPPPGSLGRDIGVEVVSLDGWPSRHSPRHATDTSARASRTSGPPLLVTRVATGSPLARAGLRPLDVILEVLYRDDVTAEARALIVRGPDGRTRTIAFTRRDPGSATDLWWPFLLSVQSDGRRSHVGVGPLELLFHRSATERYDPATDAVVRTTRTSVLGTFAFVSDEGASGGDAALGMYVVDPARFGYFGDWASDE